MTNKPIHKLLDEIDRLRSKHSHTFEEGPCYTCMEVVAAKADADQLRVVVKAQERMLLDAGRCISCGAITIVIDARRRECSKCAKRIDLHDYGYEGKE